MNNKNKKLLQQIFSKPTPKNVLYADLENLFVSLGCEILQGNGSRVAFKKNNIRVDFHKPHPNKELKPYQVNDAKNFLIKLGITI